MINIDITLKPLSVNQAWAGRRFKTSAYMEYRVRLLKDIRYFGSWGYMINCLEEKVLKAETKKEMDKIKKDLRLASKFYEIERYNDGPEIIDKNRMVGRPNMLKGWVKIHYKFYLKNWKVTDADNLVKCLQDVIVDAGYIEDDRKIMIYLIEKFPAKTDSIDVHIESIKESEFMPVRYPGGRK